MCIAQRIDMKKMIYYYYYYYGLVYILLIIGDNSIIASECPEKCICRKINEKSSGLRVTCGGLPQVKITHLKEIDFGDLRYDIVHL